jgi:hypothetical protein
VIFWIRSAYWGLRSVLFWDFTLHRLVVCYWHFRTLYWSHLQGSSSPRSMPGTLRYTVTEGMVWVVIGFQRTWC